MTFVEACELLTEILVGKKTKMNPKVEMMFDIIITSLKLGAGCILLYMMYQFSQGMEAWVELDRMMR